MKEYYRVRGREIMSIEFLLSADFNVNANYTYMELIEFLQAYKVYFRNLHTDKERFKREIKELDKHIERLEIEIEKKDKELELYKKMVKNLQGHFSRKLTFWERISGKIKL